MKKITILLSLLSALFLAGCSTGQTIKTVDGKTIVTSDKPQIDQETGLVSYKDAQTGKIEQINKDQIINMTELEK